MKSCFLWVICTSILSLGMASTASAALVSSADGSMIYDTDLDITFLSNANTVFTSGYDTSNTGRLKWTEANNWITYLNNMNGGNGYLGYNNWRLPTALNSDGSGPCGTTPCPDSELGHLFYGESISFLSQPPFSNIQPDAYWANETAGTSVPYAWTFNLRTGIQDTKIATAEFYTLAVRDGNISTVPVPAAVWLFGSGLIGLVGIARRKKAAKLLRYCKTTPASSGAVSHRDINRTKIVFA